MSAQTTKPKCYWFITKPFLNHIFYTHTPLDAMAMVYGVWAVRAKNGIKDDGILWSKLDLNMHVLYTRLSSTCILLTMMMCGNNYKPCAILTGVEWAVYIWNIFAHKVYFFFAHKNNANCRCKIQSDPPTISLSLALLCVQFWIDREPGSVDMEIFINDRLLCDNLRHTKNISAVVGCGHWIDADVVPVSKNSDKLLTTIKVLKIRDLKLLPACTENARANKYNTTKHK